ncbi:MAG: hypothetical protein ACYSUS_01870, partial [Planctomycetota bacterium]
KSRFNTLSSTWTGRVCPGRICIQCKMDCFQKRCQLKCLMLREGLRSDFTGDNGADMQDWAIFSKDC